MTQSAKARISDLLERAIDSQSPGPVNAAMQELLDLVEHDNEAMQELYERRDELLTQLDAAKINVAGVSAKMGIATLTASKMVPSVELYRVDHATGPASEIALAAFHILRYAGDVVPIQADEIEAALEEPEFEPDFASYPELFAATVAHLRTAAYYLLDPSDSFAALASEPPVQEMFPPLPFPRIWIEMEHLAPYMRFHDQRADRKARWATIDVLGIGIAEIESGRVWDILIPFDFGDESEFFMVGARIAPDRVIDADPGLREIEETFGTIRSLAIGGAHLITARNVPVEPVAFPRAQRRRMAAAEQERAGRVYFVNLANSGETSHGATDTGRDYHCRWLVRGHWRHVDSGRTFCTCCHPAQIATWIEPYIKGPVGAPWKGKQVRR